MTPTKQQNYDDRSLEILGKIKEIKDVVDESLRLGQVNGEAIRSLRLELGIDSGLHGRLPQLEAQWSRLDRQQESDNKKVWDRLNELGKCLEDLKENKHEMSGGKKVLIFLGGLFGGSAGAAIVGIIAKAVGLIH